MTQDRKAQEQYKKEKILARHVEPLRNHVLGLILVAASMVLLFLPPVSTFFVIGVFVAMPVMMFVTFWLTGYRGLFKPSARSISTGILSAAALYFIFYGGNLLIKYYHPLGISLSNASSIYGTIGTHPLALQILILLFDGFGFESYFRGTLQNFLSTKLFQKNTRTKLGAPFLASLCDCMIHIVSLNPLWVITTFIVDSIWGLTYLYTKDLSSSVSSHIIWDLFIFIIAPVR